MIYCESLSDAELSEAVKDRKRLILVGCPGCANTSLYLRNAAHGSAMMTLSPVGLKAVSMLEEMDRLAQLFSRQGKKATAWMSTYPLGILCVPDIRFRNKISRHCQGYDAVITLCCDGGTKTVGKIMNGTTVIPAMKAKGIVTAVMKNNMLFTKFYVDRNSADIVGFTVHE